MELGYFLFQLKNKGSSGESTGSHEPKKRKWFFTQRVSWSVKLLGREWVGCKKFNWLKGRVGQHLQW